MTQLHEDKINPKYVRRIIIEQVFGDRGSCTFKILHKKKWIGSYTDEDVPKRFRSRKTFDGAERAAIYLLKNYEKYF